MRFSDRVVIVTGATSGVGAATARLFAKEGAKVVVVGRRPVDGERVVAQIKEAGGEALFVATDITKKADVESMVARCMEAYGRIDVLFNNAGMAIVKPFQEYSEEEWDVQIDTHMKGTFLCSSLAIPVMTAQGGGVIINMGSTWSYTAYPGWAIYCAAKGGILMLTRAMAVDLAPHNIRVNCVCPGAIRTELTDMAIEESDDPVGYETFIADNHPMQSIGEPEDVGKTVMFLASDDASWVTGADWAVDGGRKARDRAVHDLKDVVKT